MPGKQLPQHLEVGVANGGFPVAGRKVQFTIVSDGGTITGSDSSGTKTATVTPATPAVSRSIQLLTDVNGIAKCLWTIYTNTINQQVKAELLNDECLQTHLPIHFNANQSIASQVAYLQPCAKLDDDGNVATYTTVQGALDKLSRLTSLFYAGGDGQEAMPGGHLPHPVRVSVANKCGPVVGAQVQFMVADGGGALVPNNGGTTDADGFATCEWTLGMNGKQEVVADLTNANGHPIVAPISIRFTADLSVASNVAYTPGCSYLQREKVTTVQEAIDKLCCQDGIRIDNVSIVPPSTTAPVTTLKNHAEIPVTDFIRGLRIDCDHEIDPVAVNDKPVCFVTLELPFLLPSGNGSSIYMGSFQPFILDATVSLDPTSKKAILWKPEGTVTAVRLKEFFQGLGALKISNRDPFSRILARLTLKGNFIWGKNPKLFLDGLSLLGSKNTDIKLAEGHCCCGGDFEMWFWLVPGVLEQRLPTTNVGTGTVVSVGGTAAMETVSSPIAKLIKKRRGNNRCIFSRKSRFRLKRRGHPDWLHPVIGRGWQAVVCQAAVCRFSRSFRLAHRQTDMSKRPTAWPIK